MNQKSSKGIFNTILSGEDEETTPEMEALHCLIYRNPEDLPSDVSETDAEKSVTIKKKNVSVQVWESKARIRVKVPSGTKKRISMDRIATIAMEAILKELKKEVQ